MTLFTDYDKFLCKADKITLTHPLANYTGEINDIEDYKQKIQKQKQLKNKTIKECKKLLNIEDLEIIQCDLIEDNVKEENLAPEIAKIENIKSQKGKYNPAIKPLFKNNFERYEYLMKYGCTSADDRKWLKYFKESKEYKFEQDFCSHYL